MKTLRKFLEEQLEEEGGPTNSVGGGAIAGLGVGPQGEPPGPANVWELLRRKKLADLQKEFGFKIHQKNEESYDEDDNSDDEDDKKEQDNE